MELLVARGAEIDVRSADDSTPLRDAEQYKQPQAAAWLRQHGATE
jgi:hypothetical protein